MDLNLRNVDEEMVRRLKADALEARRTLREHCLILLGGRIEERSDVERKPTKRAPAVVELKTVSNLLPAMPTTTYQRPAHSIGCSCLMCRPPKA